MGVCSSKLSVRVEPRTITPIVVNQHITPLLPTNPRQSTGLQSEVGAAHTSSASKSAPLNEDSEGDSRVFPPQVIHINPSVPPNFYPSHREGETEIQCRNTIAQLKPRKSEAAIRDEVQQLIARWKESGQLSIIEHHVLSISSSQTSSIQELSHALVVPYAAYIDQLKGKQLHLEVAKAYAIYFWITTNIKYDKVAYQAYLSGEKPSKAEPSLVLKGRKSMCCGYSNLYKALAVHIGIQVTVIQGHTKGWQIFSDDLNAQFIPSRANSHFWNTVMLGGVWFPIDCTFGSGAVTSGNTEFTPEFTRHYFAVPPERLVLTHWPSDESRQLLESPISLQQMQPLIPAHAQVFAVGVQPENWSECIHSFDSPVVRVELKAEPDMKFTAKLTECNAVLKGAQKPDLSVPGIDRATYLQRSKKNVAVNATFPHSGHFSLNIYMKEPVSEGQHDPRYQLCLSYQVRCEFSHQSQVGYPLVFDAASSAFGFQLLYWNLPQKSYIRENEAGKLEVVFRANPDVHFYHCLLPGKVKDADSSAADQYHTMIARDSEDPSLFALQIVLPEVGWWTVSLCAAKADVVDVDLTGTVGYTAVLNYHVLAKKALQKHSYPLPLSHDVTFESCTPICASGREPLSLPFTSPRALEFDCYMTHTHPDGERVDLCTKVINLGSSDCVGTSNHRYALKVIFPKPGKWYVHVYAKDESSETMTSYFGLFNLCLETDSGMVNTIFPYLNTALAKELSIDLNTSDALVFPDDGAPFQMQFLAPTDFDAQHDIELLSTTQNSTSAEQHCTALQCTPSSNASSCKYTLTAVFPFAGRWSVRLFASSVSGADQRPGLVIRADVEVSNPTPDVAYLKLHPAFNQLSLSVPHNYLQYKVVCDSPEFQLPFNAPDDLHFAWTMKHLPSGEELCQQAFVHYSMSTEKNLCDHRLDLVLSRPGEWQLCLFAKPINTQEGVQTEADETQNYSSILDFQIQTKEVITDRAFPQIFQPFSCFGMRMENPSALPLPSIVNQIPISVTIPFYSPPQLKFWHCTEVAEVPDNVYNTRMISNLGTGMHELAVEISEQGHWTVTLYAQHISSSSQNWVAVLQHSIFADI